MSKAGYESWADVELNSFNGLSILSTTGKVPNLAPGGGDGLGQRNIVLEYKSQIEEVVQCMGSGLVSL